jgi:hypothetical protein
MRFFFFIPSKIYGGSSKTVSNNDMKILPIIPMVVQSHNLLGIGIATRVRAT